MRAIRMDLSTPGEGIMVGARSNLGPSYTTVCCLVARVLRSLGIAAVERIQRALATHYRYALPPLATCCTPSTNQNVRCVESSATAWKDPWLRQKRVALCLRSLGRDSDLPAERSAGRNKSFGFYESSVTRVQSSTPLSPKLALIPTQRCAHPHLPPSRRFSCSLPQA